MERREFEEKYNYETKIEWIEKKNGDLVVDDNLRFTKIRITPKIGVNKNIYIKTVRAISLAEKYCLVTNSLNVPLELNYNIYEE